MSLIRREITVRAAGEEAGRIIRLTIPDVEAEELSHALKLARIAEILEENYPAPEDKSAYVTDVITLPASSEVTVTYEFARGWRYYVAALYVDVAPDCEGYVWRLYGTTDADVEEFYGNEHHFTRRKIIIHNPKISLTARNTSGTVDQELDLYIDMWARKV